MVFSFKSISFVRLPLSRETIDCMPSEMRLRFEKSLLSSFEEEPSALVV